MKHLFTTLLCLLIGTSAFAQLPAGSDAPNFTARDINGRLWDLYDVLESGRPVIMDVSATWCGPCWSYHNSHALEDLYATYGPEGSGEVMVFFIEGDNATNTNCLYGPSGCNNSTQGNWVANTPYPIIDNSTIANQYDISYFPTIYKICPDKKVTEVGTLSAAGLWNQISGCVGDIPANLCTVNKFDAGTIANDICTSQTGSPVFTLLNLGKDPVEEAVVELSFNGTVLQTKTFTGEAIPFDLFDVQFDEITISEAGMLKAEVVSVNGADNSQIASSEIEFNLAEEKFTANQVVLKIRTDFAGQDIYWEAYDDAGNVIKHGGNEAVGINGGGAFPNGSPSDPTAYGSGQIHYDTIDVPASGCFSFRIVDGAGNGLIFPAYYRFYDLGNSSPFYSNLPTFKEVGSHSFTQITTSVEQPKELEVFGLYPNPASTEINMELNITRAADVQIAMLNTVGQVVYSQKGQTLQAGEQTLTFPVDQLSNGVYFMQVQTETGTVTRRFVVEN
ncbi:MAG: T9SS type A sorting domain-containing protein [Saprospiraceae bacterium]